MSPLLLLKLFGGITVAAGVGTGGYFLKEYLSKSKEEEKKKAVSTDGAEQKPPGNEGSTDPKTPKSGTETPPKGQPSGGGAG